MISLSRREECCGCSACEQICPKHCISLLPDNEGFLYPIINKQICIDCHRCEKVCPVLNQDSIRTPQRVLAAYNIDETVREASSSGGIFTIVAEEVIKQNGIVFGVKFDEEWDAIYDYTDYTNGLEAFRGSKYVQAFVGDVYSKVQKFLEEGRLVLFSGTPCQIAGLRKYLNKEYNNLLLMDLICEGVPSPKVWKRYLHEEIYSLCKNHYHIPNENIVIQKISFRNKKDGWKNFAFSLKIAYIDENKRLVSLPEYVNRASTYLQAMFRFLDLRPICYECPFKCNKSHSDITIADYWGIDTLHPEMDDDKGTSMIYCNTEKGESILPLSHMRYIETNYEEALAVNNIIKSVNKHPNRDKFYAKIDSGESIISLLQHNTFPLKKEIIKSILTLLLPKSSFYNLQKWVWRQRKR